MTMIDPWFLVQMEDLIKEEEKVKTLGLTSIDRDLMFKPQAQRLLRSCVWPNCWA